MTWARLWRALIARIKRSLEWLVYGLFDHVALRGLPPRPKPGRVAVVHLELLGDALLWLPYGQALVRHLHTEGKQVVLVADAQLERVLGDMLPGCEWLGIPRRGFVRNPGQRWRMLRQLRRRGVAETYLMRYPRDALIQDATVRALAGVAWGFDAVFPDRPILDRRLSRALYEHRIPAQYRTCTSAKDTTHF